MRLPLGQIGRLADWQIGRLADWQIGGLADFPSYAHRFRQRSFPVRLIKMVSDKKHLTKSGTKRFRAYIESYKEEVLGE